MDGSNRKPRPLIRSLLAVPATSRRFLEKASQSSADAVFIDLEDAVVPAQKEAARNEVIVALMGPSSCGGHDHHNSGNSCTP